MINQDTQTIVDQGVCGVVWADNLAGDDVVRKSSPVVCATNRAKATGLLEAI